jgi:hypothetical protein
MRGVLRSALVGMLGLACGATSACAAGSTASVAPSGPVPPQWKVYRGQKLGVVVAYPPSWTVNEENVPVGSVSFLSGASETVTISRTARPTSTNVSLLRDRYLSFAVRTCETGKTVQGTGSVDVGTLRFETATARCAPEHENSQEEGEAEVYYVGATLKGSREWTFLFHADADEFEQHRHDEFDPMLATLKIL